MQKYDFLIIGSGLFGSVFAFEASKRGKKCLVIEKRSHVGGNIFTEKVEGVTVHKYGAHIFHTSNQNIWEYINQFADFNRYTNSPIANYRGEIYNLPFNMNTFYKMWGTVTPEQAKAKIAEQCAALRHAPLNLEEQAISLVGKDIYEKLIKGYTEKQWGRDCTKLPPFIIKRLPVRFIYDNNYFNDRYQGIPIGGYTQIIEKMLQKSEVMLNTDFCENKQSLMECADKIIYTGTIDSYFNYQYGHLEYRSLRFETEVLDQENYQGVAVMNYTDRETPFTRIIEHKHFENATHMKTVITKEYPEVWKSGMEPYYPVNDEKNQALYQKYSKLAEYEKKTTFGGRLAEYKYYDMDKVIACALEQAKKELKF